MTPTRVYDSYWRFAAERHAIYMRRLGGAVGPWTQDPILRAYRFTNTFRAADRVSQYLIGSVQYRSDRSQAGPELFFRTILFKLFNKISTWELLEQTLGPLSWQSADFEKIGKTLDNAIDRGRRIYSAAYIMPPPRLGHSRKHANHLSLLRTMMEDGLPRRIEQAKSLASVYEMIKPYPGLGPFLAFQYAIDLNYSNLLGFPESEFVVAGPGALDGIAKCFSDSKGLEPSSIINEMVSRQDIEFKRLGVAFDGLFGRPLQPIDCQNIFCEISKYARVAHPEFGGISGRTRIKQSYRPDAGPLLDPVFPPRWKISPPLAAAGASASRQLELWD